MMCFKDWKPDYQPFVGAELTYEPSMAGNREAEIALVYLALTAEDVCGDLLDRVEPRDFNWDDTRFIFTEVVNMRDAKLPIQDKAALSSWFRRPDVAERMRACRLDWFTEEGRPIPWVEILEIAVGAAWATAAHIDYYVSELRRWRLVRAFRIAAWDLIAAADDGHEAWEVIEWLAKRLEQLRALAKPLRKESDAVLERQT